MKTISIVTPSYNQGQYIEQTIKSVLSQEGDFLIDYIIADGGSTDNSVEVIKKYDELLKKNLYPIKCRGVEFHWWSKKDRGQSDAINQGFRLAKGEILAWINSDDFYEPGAFEAVDNIFSARPNLDLVYGDYFKLFAQEEKLVKAAAPNPAEDYQSLLATTGSFGQPATFFTKRIAERVGYVDESLHYCMDYDLWIKIFKIGKTAYLPRTLATFRIWEDSKTATSQEKFDAERRMIAKRYGGNILTPRKVNRFIDSFRWRYFVKDTYPSLYYALKKVFFALIDSLKY